MHGRSKRKWRMGQEEPLKAGWANQRKRTEKDLQVIENNPELSEFYSAILEAIFASGQRNKRKTLEMAIETTKQHAKERSIAWKQPGKRRAR